jgi:hypothetical protein
LHKFSNLHELFVANSGWGIFVTASERFSEKACPGLDPGGRRFASENASKQEASPVLIQSEPIKVLGAPFARPGGCRFTLYQRGTRSDVDDRRGGLREFSEQRSGTLFPSDMFYPDRRQWSDTKSTKGVFVTGD